MAAFPLTVTPSPTHLQLKPGGTATVAVTIGNVSDIVEHYQVTLVGLPSNDYWTAEPAVTKLRPRESSTINVEITLPEKGILGGRYPLGVLVTSPYQPEVGRSADVVLDVGTVSGVALTATPMIAYGKTSTEYLVSLKNDGNIDVPFELRATDDQGRADIDVTPSTLYVQPGSAQAARVTVDAPGVLTGPERRSAIAIKALAEGETRGEVQVTFIQPPRVPPGVLRALGIVLSVAVVAASIVAGAVIGKSSQNAGQGTSNASGGAASQGPGGKKTKGGPSPTVSSTGPGQATKPTVTPITVAPEPVLTEVETTFSATSSAAEATWAWQILDAAGASIAEDETPQQFSHTFEDPGAYTVTLTVTAAGLSSEAASLPVTVTAQPPKVTIVPKPITIAAGQTVSDAAVCPPNLVALSGGVEVAAAPIGTVLQSSFGPGGPDSLNQWAATVNNPTAAAVAATVLAVCAEAPAGYDVNSAPTLSIGSGTTAEQLVSCGRGLVALGGGGGVRSDTVPDTTQGILEESTPVRDADKKWTGWRIRARNDSAVAQPLTAQVVCAKMPVGYDVRPVERTVAAGTEEVFGPECEKKGSDAIGGGVEASETMDPESKIVLRASANISSSEGSTKERWSTTLQSTGTANQPMTAWTICARL